MKQVLLVKRVDMGIAILSLNRPESANALNRDLLISLTEQLGTLRWDPEIRVVIVTGEGEKAFCAGIDLKERAQKEPEELLAERETIIRPFFLSLGNFHKPIIAAINGPALGGGAELALTCDMRVAVPEARFAQREVKWGMIPSCGACQRLRLIVGMGAAKEIILTGRVLEAEEAFGLRIYNCLAPKEKLMDKALDLARQISANPSTAVEQAKKALDLGADISGALEMDFELSRYCFQSGEALSSAKTFQPRNDKK